MRGVLVAMVMWWAAAAVPSVVARPGLADVGSGPTCGATAHQDLPSMPPMCGRPARSLRLESLDRPVVDGGVAPADVPLAIARPEEELDAPHGARGGRAGLVSSVTRAPRAPPRG